MRRYLAPAFTLALVLTAAPAEAQLGKLKKIGGDLAKEAGREADGLPKGNKPAESSASSASSASSKAPVDYTITDERADLILAALAPAIEEARRESAAREVRASYDAKMQQLEKCAKTASQGMTGYSQAYLDKAGPLTEKQAALMQRYGTAMQAGRKRDVLYMQDSAAVISYELITLMSGAKCGKAPYKPAALIEAELAREAQSQSGAELGEDGRYSSKFEVPEPARKSLTPRQFGLMRERMALYALELTRADASPPSFSNFSEGERATLGARAGQLKALAPFFRDGVLRWSTWGDLKGW